MTQLLFPQAPALAPVVGESRRFPVRRIYCVGRNYAAHVAEMGGSAQSHPPIFFMKPADAVDTSGRAPYPHDTKALHHEVELVVAIGRGGWDVNEAQALDLIYGYAVGIDLTKRDAQAQAKAAGEPWERAKAFEHSAPLSAIVPAEQIGHPESGEIALSVNGAVRQRGDLSQMILKTPALIARLSELWTLAPGDLIFTGTPDGVGPLAVGDRVAARVAGVGDLEVEIG